jgi:hypothetical protein
MNDPVSIHRSDSPDTSFGTHADMPLPRGWEARPRFDAGWTLARSGRSRQAVAIRWATLALATVTGAVFLFGHGLLALVGRGIEPLALVLMGSGLAAIYWLEHRGPVFRLSAGRIERRSGLGGRFVRVYESPSVVLTSSGDEGWAVVLRHDHVPEILAGRMTRHDAFALASFVARHTGAGVDLPGEFERELAGSAGPDASGRPGAPNRRSGTHG